MHESMIMPKEYPQGTKENVHNGTFPAHLTSWSTILSGKMKWQCNKYDC